MQSERFFVGVHVSEDVWRMVGDVAKARGVKVSDLIRSAFHAIGIEIPKPRRAGRPRKYREVVLPTAPAAPVVTPVLPPTAGNDNTVVRTRIRSTSPAA